LKASQDQLRKHAVTLEARNEDLRHSERRLLEDSASLQSRNAELDAFAHTVAHDLKEPLALIVTASALIRGFTDLPRQKLEDMLQRIESSAIEASRIVDGLLLLSQVRKVEAPREPVDMSALVADARNRLSETIQQQEAVVVVPERWPAAVGYGPWLTEVWTNYLSNALKYGGQPPRVELGAALQPDGMVRFWARDNGSGVPPEARERLFIPFSEFGKIRISGHGLGLSIVLQIVEKLGGEVGVESEIGKGSLFYFTLPADH
jgi:signal transduction histidine kinase